MSDKGSNQSAARRYKAYVSPFGTTQIHLRNPFVVAWWSMAFPGLGHILISKYLRGYILFIWEIFLNYQSHINLAIIYSFTGKFEIAKEVLDNDWLFLYIPTYLFAIWDSYRTAVDINHNYLLASREDAEIKTFSINAVEINYLDKRTPWVSMVWSAFSPGTGQLYIHRLFSAFFILAWWMTIIYFSKFLPAIYFTLTGDFAKSISVLDPQWYLNISSIHFFAMYDAYVKTVENNKLFDWEQSKFLNKSYQNNSFHMPKNKEISRGECMYIISTFHHSIYLELAITDIQMKGIPKESILAVPMDKRDEKMKLFDSMHQSDGLSSLDIPMILAAAFSVLGNIYGFVLKFGPIICGLFGAFIGLSLGLLIKFFTAKKIASRHNNKNSAEVVLIIECKENQLEMIKNALWENNALGVRQLIPGSDN